MNNGKVYVTLESFDQRLMINSLVSFKNDLEKQGKPTEDVSYLIMKVINAPSARDKRRTRDAR